MVRVTRRLIVRVQGRGISVCRKAVVSAEGAVQQRERLAEPEITKQSLLPSRRALASPLWVGRARYQADTWLERLLGSGFGSQNHDPQSKGLLRGSSEGVGQILLPKGF